MTRTLTAALAGLLLLMAAAGCGMFETREPEEGEGEQSLWQPPTSPEIIVRNLEVAFENGIFNDYERALTPDFTFHPDLADSLDVEGGRPGAFANWTRDVEVQTASAIFASADSLILLLGVPSIEIEGDDRLMKQNYLLTLLTAGGSTIYEGDVWFWVRQVGGEWYIYHWEDIATSSSRRSWGFLKGNSRPGV
jgi:hypothetical protein